ncbi:ATP-dependent DNA helicase [Clostridium sp.]|uniref:ATP-dependent DNA helicase n=1 Tax=Clostridium sp. TaxID=1506 RepID=UPI002908273A|nr:ATP-dependent DNA helicase [Clostridium sp.]MDU5695338.1 ATP-dependent DNA helicase [Clostridium sp.]
MDKRRRISDEIMNKIFEVIDSIPNKGLEIREAQEDIMLNIVEAFKNKSNFLVEAGVGIGKSLSYLIPAILISKIYQRPCVIATGTIQLTEQLIEDVKLAEYILKCRVNVVIGKGQSNYPCIKRMIENVPEKYKKKFERYSLLVNDNVDKQNPNGIDLNDWDKICVNGCIFSGCKYNDDCYYYKIRKRMSTTTYFESYPKIVIINQDLMISHFLKEENDFNGLLDQRMELLVIDEIHNLEEKTRSALTKEIDIRFIERTFNEYIRIITGTSKNMRAIDKARGVKDDIVFLLKNIFIKLKYKYLEKDKDDLERVYIEKGDNSKCNELRNEIKMCLEDLDLAITFGNNVREHIERMYSSVVEKLSTINRFLIVLGGDNSEDLIWGNLKSDYIKMKISISPKEIDKVVSRLIFRKNIPTIGLSATIATEINKDPYEYIKSSIGFTGETDEIRKSPFPYENSRLLIPNKLPNVHDRNEEYYQKISVKIVEIISNVKGGTLVLFTSKEDLKKVNEKLVNLVNEDISIYSDDSEHSQKEIIEEFKKVKKGVILGTGVFWEGISLKGDLLTCVIIVRLPFPVPDPVIEYKIEKASFEKDKVIVPEMITKLKQGSGRLIRTMSDKGILVLLDSRMNENNYKHRNFILEAIPIKRIIKEISEVEKFFNEEYS